MRFFIFLSFFYSAFLYANPIEVSVDRSLINLNESFDITFTCNETPNKMPDFSPLSKDFEVLSKNQGSSMSWVNGKRSVKVQWVFSVIAKKSGKLKIPTVNFGRVSSPVVFIQVNKNKTRISKNDDATIFLEVSANPLKPHVQSQVLYTLRFFRRVQITEASLDAPDVKNAVIEKIGDDKHYRTERAGQSYAVTERTYAIFPQKSGTLIIPALTLKAIIVANNSNRFNRLFGAQNTHQTNAKSKEIKLEVQPIPANFKGKQWLAAQKMILSEQWSGDTTNLQVGEPLTRTLTLEANGVMMGQLPTLQPELSIQNLKIYPDKPNLKETRTETGVVGIREEKTAFILSQNGTYTLPEINIDWFNLKTGKIETLALPEKVITVVGGSISPPQDIQKPIEKQPVINNPAPLTTDVSNSYFWQALSVFFAIAWGITLWKLFYKKTPVKKREDTVQNKSLRTLKETLAIACHENDRQTTKKTLLAWGTLHGYNASSLGVLAPFCSHELRDEILVLNQNLYSQFPEEWSGELLLKAFNAYKIVKKVSKKTDDDLLE
ncbi:MAG: protein BatD, partial [Methylococcales bacterium]|nr:protein BatD [Methylococcales bacterium]